MKKRLLFLLILLTLIAGVSLNRIIRLKYNVNLGEYYGLSQGLTEGERLYLEVHEPLIYGGNMNEPPLGIYDHETGGYIGLVVDYISAIALELNTPIESRPMIWEDALEALSASETDMCDMIPSEERQKHFYFTMPLYHLRGIAVTTSYNREIHTLADLNGKRIGVQRGDYVIEKAQAHGLSVEFVMTDNLDDAMVLLTENRVDAVLGDEPVILYYMKELANRDFYRLLEEPLYDEVSAIAVPRDQPQLVRILNKAILKLRKKGILEQINHKWSGLSSTFYEDNKLAYVQLGSILVMMGMVIAGYFIYLWNSSLKHLVAVRTRELESIKDELQITFDGMKTFLAVFDKEGKVININSACLQFLGRDLEEVIGQPFEHFRIFDVLNDAIDNQFRESFALSDAKGDAVWHAKEFAWFDGNIYEIDIYPLKPDGQTTSQILIILEDRTLERLEEQKMVHANKMAAIGQLASGVAHELRNPLGVIRNSSFILRDVESLEEEERQMALDAIDNSVSRSGKIIDNLLNFSRLSNDHVEEVSLLEFVQETTRLFKKQFEEAHIDLKVVCLEPCVMSVNTESFKHILINLITNAVDAMSEGGELTIGWDKLTEGVEFYVKDSGLGMDQALQEKIFDPFFTTKAVGKGTGLGLYIVYSEAEKIGAALKMTSKVGEGTTFILTFKQRSHDYE
ncbi:MAG: transporter substrate-binding domain-containing protein [Clostridia bacterium]|nr:transporter substrate-binding domain-containing protein [Clostridia bacterium]